MPVTLVDRLPLPNLKAYTAGSVALLAVAVYHALGATGDPAWRANATLQAHKGAGEAGAEAPLTGTPPLELNATRNLTEQFTDVMTFMMQEPLCMWTVINMCYCALAVAACAIQRAVFGALRASEAQRVKDKLWNYVFYKFIFVFGVINVQYMDEVLLWCAWFTLIGFLHLLAHLAKDRFEYLSSSPRTARGGGGVGDAGGSGGREYRRLVALVCGLAAAGGALMVVAYARPPRHDHHTFFFMAAECYLVVLSALHVLARHLLAAREADVAGPVAYYTHLFFDASSLVVESAHVVHMVWVARLLVSAPSLVLLLQLRHLLHRLQARLRKHRLYAALTSHMSQHYPMASKEEVEKNQDNCAICWEPMKEARKLPCAHLFHNSCLCQWVQQDASCPTCRRALHAAPGAPPAAAHPAPAPTPAGAALAGAGAGPRSPLGGLGPLAAAAAAAGAGGRVAPNRLFHFDGSRYVSWLPSFSVEVTRLRAVAPLAPAPAPAPHQLERMALQVQSLFPQHGLPALMRDLSATRSVDHTVNNILEGRLAPPPPAPPAAPAPAATGPAAADRPAGAGAEPWILSRLPAEPDASTSAPPAPAPAAAPPIPAFTAAAAAADLGSAFSQEARERETALQQRKAQLLAAARRKYLDKLAVQPSTAAPAPPPPPPPAPPAPRS